MAKRVLSGFLGVLILPDVYATQAAAQLTDTKGVRHAEYRVKPEGVHITLYQARNFKQMPVSVAEKLVAKLNEFLVSNRAGELLLYMLDIKPYQDNEQYLFWNIDRTKKHGRLMDAHGMSLALSAWVDPSAEDEASLERRIAEMSEKRQQRERKLCTNKRVFGHTLVGEDYLPHITLAANTKGFKKFKPTQEALISSASRVVLARMGEWGKIEEILI
ncbi:MAG: hypothetical protein WCK01_01595 [Candidatus Uhrbacteria bacterium]